MNSLPLILVCILLPVFTVRAQDKLTGQNKLPVDPPELITAREQHLREMQRVTAPELQTYLTKLNTLKQQFAREGKFGEVTTVENELRVATRQLQLVREASDMTKTAPQQLMIVTAVYGDPSSNRTVDVARTLQQAFAAGLKNIDLNTGVLNNGQDPAPRTRKVIVINYYLGGEKKETRFREGYTLNFQNDLQ